MPIREELAKTGNVIARICWNDKGWKYPSGPSGKSKDKNSYEQDAGFGHEEWLLDYSRLIDGWHYAFLEPMRTKKWKHAGKTYNISLYTIHRDTKQKRYVGEINNVECLTPETSTKICEIYSDKGWFSEMAKEVRRSGANPGILTEDFKFNIKFRIEDVHVDGYQYVISEEDDNITSVYYNLLQKKHNFLFASVPADPGKEGKFKDTETTFRITDVNSVIDPIHNKMQKALYKVLRETSVVRIAPAKI